MGGAVSSGRMTTLIQTLKQEHCPLSHPIWNELSIDDMPNQYLSDEDIQNLTIIKNEQPDNFSSLIRFTVEIFSDASKISDFENSQNSKYINVCNFICLLLSISNDLDNTNTNFNCWFKAIQTNLSASKPINNLIETLQRLLRFNDPIQLFLQSSILDLRINYTKTLLFLIHAKSLGGIQSDHDPSQFLLTFDAFCWNRFLNELFEIIPIVLSKKDQSNTTVSEKEQLLVRSLITFAIPCIYSCKSWDIQQINSNLIQSSFSILKQYENSKVISLCEQLVTLLFVTISNHPAFLNDIISSNKTMNYITALLYFYQIRFFKNKKSSFLHKIILIIINILLTSSNELIFLNEKFVGHFTIRSYETVKIHRGTIADLIIEVITNPLVFDSNSIESITPLVSDIILNLSKDATCLSFFSGNRIFLVLKKLFVSGLFQKVQFENPIKNLLCSIFQMIRYHSKSNINLFTLAVENERLMNHIISISQIHNEKANYRKVTNKNWSYFASSIMKMVDAARTALSITDQNKKIELFGQLIEKVDAEFIEEPEKAEKIMIESFIEINQIWFDWLRLLFWITFPKEAKKAGLSFATFDLDSTGKGRDKLQNKKEKKQFQEVQQSQKMESQEIQRIKNHEDQKLEQIKNQEKEQTENQKLEQTKNPETGQIKNPEAEQIKNQEKEQTENQKLEQTKNPETGQIKNPEAEQIKNQEKEQTENQKLEQTENPETGQINNQETEKKENHKLNQINNQETEQIENNQQSTIKEDQEKEILNNQEKENPTQKQSEVHQNQVENKKFLNEESETQLTHEKEQQQIQTETEQQNQQILESMTHENQKDNEVKINFQNDQRMKQETKENEQNQQDNSPNPILLNQQENEQPTKSIQKEEVSQIKQQQMPNYSHPFNENIQNCETLANQILDNQEEEILQIQQPLEHEYQEEVKIDDKQNQTTFNHCEVQKEEDQTQQDQDIQNTKYELTEENGFNLNDNESDKNV